MKKIFFSLVAMASALVLNAQVYYLMPTATLPVEQINEETTNAPEQRAHDWFLDAAGFNGAGVVTMAELVAGLDDNVKVLWINVDRVGLSLVEFDAMFNDTVTNALKGFVQNGGNLFLTKQAARLVSKIERTDWWPNQFSNGGYGLATDEWQMTVNFCTGGNVAEHACFRYMENGQTMEEIENCRYPMVSGENYYRTDNNSAWGDWLYYLGDNGEGAPRYGGCDSLRRSTFENHINGKVLGGWGHTRGMDFAGFIEFYPTETYTGRVMAMGLAAYQWGAQNASEYNVKNLTKGVLEYLTPAPTPTAVMNVSSATAIKTVENGQVVILKNGVRYNVLGTQL